MKGEYGVVNNKEEDFARMALELGGAQIKLDSSVSSTVNLFDFDKPEIKEEILEQKERDLRALLNEANKCYSQGSLLAIDYLDKFNEIPGLKDNPEWKERAKKILQEFAEQISIKNMRIRMGMSQSQFANYIGIPVRTLQEWEQGKRTPPSYIVKMVHNIMRLEDEKKKEFAKKKYLVEQYTEKDYTMDQLIQIYTQKMGTSRKDGVILEFITQKPLFDENGKIIGITTDFPAELNVYTYKAPNGIILNPFNKKDIEKGLWLHSEGKSIASRDMPRKKYEPYIASRDNCTQNETYPGFGITESGKTALLDIQSLMNEAKKAGYKVLEFKDIPASYETFNPFAGTYDILGEERKSFIEKLSEITEFLIIDEDNKHTRIRYKQKEHGYTEEELNKLYSDFFTLKNSMKVQIRIVSAYEKK